VEREPARQSRCFEHSCARSRAGFRPPAAAMSSAAQTSDVEKRAGGCWVFAILSLTNTGLAYCRLTLPGLMLGCRSTPLLTLAAWGLSGMLDWWCACRRPDDAAATGRQEIVASLRS